MHVLDLPGPRSAGSRLCPNHPAVFIGSASRSAFKEVGIDRDVLPPLLGNQRPLEDRRDGAGGFARAALDTFIGIDRKMLSCLKLLLIWRGVDAINGTHLDAGCVF